MDRPKIILIAVLGGIFILGALIFTGIIPGLKKNLGVGPTTLEMWGFEDEENDLKQFLIDYREKTNQLITVNYVKKDPATYEQGLINALAAGKGPDIFVLKNTWVSEHKDKLYPLPQDKLNFSVRDFVQTYVDAVADNLVINNKIAGLPLYLDNLVLFYNKDHLNSAGIAAPPRTWDEVVDAAKKLTKYTPGGDIDRSGIALGTYSNIAHAFEIVSALILQGGDKIIDRQTGQLGLSDNSTKQALVFYASFSNPKSIYYSWNNRMDDSLRAFAKGNASMIIGAASDIPAINEKNPHLNFDAAPLPQLAGANKKLTLASYTFFGVSRASQNPEEAWKFLLWLSGKETDKRYLAIKNLPPARRDLVSEPPRGLEVFYDQTLFAKDWPVPEENAVLRIFKDMIESIYVGRSSVDFALNQARQQLGLLIQK